MHYLFALVLWGLSFAAAYSVGRSWVEAKHANGFPWLGAWFLAALTSVGFTSAYFLLILAILETVQSDGVTPDMTAGLWDAWIVWLVAPVLAFGGMSFLGTWARTYRDAISVSSLAFPSYAVLNQRYGSVTSTPQAARAVTRDLTKRTRGRLFAGRSEDMYIDPGPALSSGQFTLPEIKLPKVELGWSDGGGGDDGGGLVLVTAIVAAIIALGIGIVTTWVVISRIAGESEPLSHPAPASA